MISSLTDEELIDIKEKVFLDVRRIWGSEMADQLTVDFARKAVKEIIDFTKSFTK